MDRSFERQPPTAEEGFEDVGLDDKQPQPRKRGFFSKFSEPQAKDVPAQPVAVSRFLSHGRKRAPSGQGAELGSMDQSKSAEGQEMQ